MIKSETKIAGISVALTTVLIFIVLAVLTFPGREFGVLEKLADNKEKLTLAQLIVSFLGFIGAISAFALAIFQYRKSTKWKRMEFIANEIKEFEADPVLQNALLMIDWGTRKINLNNISNPKESDFVTIEREDQWKALLPHPLKDKEKYPEYQSVKFATIRKADTFVNSQQRLNFYNFGIEEAKIRDTYDVFLTRLDRFATFIDAKLIDAGELRPFISYWIDALTKNTEPEKDAKWRCVLLSYIIYYDYSGVESLLKKYDRDIDPKGNIYQDIMRSVKDEKLTKELIEQLKR